jgi:hypothetical protein
VGTLVQHDEIEPHTALLDACHSHCVGRGAAAFGRAAGVEDLEAVRAHLVEWHVRVAEDDGIRAVAEPAAHAVEAPSAWAGVMDERDPGVGGLDSPFYGQQASQIGSVDVSMHSRDRWAERLQFAQDLDRREIAAVKQQIGGGYLLGSSVREPAPTAGQVGIGEDGDQHPWFSSDEL